MNYNTSNGTDLLNLDLKFEESDDYNIIATYVLNSYSQEARLFISIGEKITSAEGTAQGDPSAMLIFAVISLSLLNMTTTDSTKHALNR